MTKILITGASGFVGRHILQTLMQFEHPDLHIVAATRHPEKLPASYRGEVRVGDLRDADYLDRVLTGIQVICHAAGWAHYSNNPTHAKKYYLEPTLDLINRAREWRVARFVNLSNLAVTLPAHRRDDDAPGKPQRSCSMLNCLIAVEEYLKTQANPNMSVINLRGGVYCGPDLNIGLLPLLLQRPHLPLIAGQYGHLPITDGRDLGQAFARAALHPQSSAYQSFNIVGSDNPSQPEALLWLHQEIFKKHHQQLALPASLGIPVQKLLSLFKQHNQQPVCSATMTRALCNPVMQSQKAKQMLGYQAQYNWQRSASDFVEDYLKHEPNVYFETPEHEDM